MPSKLKMLRGRRLRWGMRGLTASRRPATARREPRAPPCPMGRSHARAPARLAPACRSLEVRLSPGGNFFAQVAMPFRRSTTWERREIRIPELLTLPPRHTPSKGGGVGRPRPDLSPPRRTFRPGSTPGTRMPPNRSECAPTWAAPLLLPLPLLLLLPRHSQPTASNDDTRRMRTRAGSVHRLGGRRLGRSAKVSSARHMAIGNCRRTMRDARCGFPAATQI
jgi:hypothetical protein